MTRLACARIRVLSRLGAAITIRPAVLSAKITVAQIARCEADGDEIEVQAAAKATETTEAKP